MSADINPFDDPKLSSTPLSRALNKRTQVGEDEDDSFYTPDGTNTTRALAELHRQNLALRRQLAEEHQVNQRLLALNDFGKDFESAPHPERAAHDIARLLVRLLNCGLVCVLEYQQADGRFKMLSAAGQNAGTLPASFLPDTSQRIFSLAVHNQCLVSSIDLQEAAAPLQLGGQHYPSLVVAPLVRGRLRGLLLLADTGEQVFNASDYPVIETAAAQLLNAWQYTSHNETLTEFVQAISMMSVVQEAPSLLEMTASIARQTLDASYVIAAALNQQ